MSYWDTSALAKLYVPEPDSATYQQQAIRPGSTLVTGRLGCWELRRVVLGKEAAAILRPGDAETVWRAFNDDVRVKRLKVVETDAAIEVAFNQIMERCYRRTPPLFLRTLDAIHLASARVAGETEIVATDKRLREAAVLLGFTLFPA